MKTFTIGLLCALIIMFGSVYAQAAEPDVETWKDAFQLSLGIGLSMPKDRNITNTVVANKMVRVTGEQKHIPALWLTTQWLYRTSGYTGFGPFLGVGLDADNGIFSSLGAGLMFSMTFEPWKKRGESQSSFNIGLGYSVQKVKVLGDGIDENMILPEGEESVRFKEKYSAGPLLMFSFNVF